MVFGCENCLKISHVLNTLDSTRSVLIKIGKFPENPPEVRSVSAKTFLIGKLANRIAKRWPKDALGMDMTKL